MNRKPPSRKAVRELNAHLLMLAEELEEKKRRCKAFDHAEHLAMQIEDLCREYARSSRISRVINRPQQ
jgi:hypothetical protein